MNEPLPAAAESNAASLEADWDTFCAIENEIGQAESTGIEARWRCGQMLLRYEKRQGSKNSPLAAAVRHLSAELGVSEDELYRRRQFSDEYPNLSHACEKFGSWHEIVASGLGERDKNGKLDVHYSSATDNWATPQDLFDLLDEEFNFTLDVCASQANAKCERYFDIETDGLTEEWTGACWMNPPYGDVIGDWMEKAYNEAQARADVVVCLVPARVDTGWWWDYARYGEVRFLRGRLKFGGGDTGAPFPSAVVVFGVPSSVVWWERWQRD